MYPEMHVEVALVLGGVGAVAALEVHVLGVTTWLHGSFPLVGVLDVVLKILLSSEGSLAVLALEVVFVNILSDFALKGKKFPCECIIEGAVGAEGLHEGRQIVGHWGSGEEWVTKHAW